MAILFNFVNFLCIILLSLMFITYSYEGTAYGTIFGVEGKNLVNQEEKCPPLVVNPPLELKTRRCIGSFSVPESHHS